MDCHYEAHTAYIAHCGLTDSSKAKELLKTLFFTGAVMLIMPGSPEQIIVAFLVGLVDLVMYSVFAPYPSKADDFVAIAGDAKAICNAKRKRQKTEGA